MTQKHAQKKQKIETEAMSSDLQTVLAANKSLLEAAISGDWATYATLVVGTDLKVTTLVNPEVRFLSADKTAALVAYVRLTQFKDASGKPVTSEISETRIWARSSSTSNDWKNVHFQRGSGKL
ncbi:UNVERIFIED_CONTAM: hypothetical protein HDU68_005315 [Siphonaria sp. JEL0065]|nr:hypothetical protein HDU68_005315 [Siphonaria sp. JEL0065]